MTHMTRGQPTHDQTRLENQLKHVGKHSSKNKSFPQFLSRVEFALDSSVSTASTLLLNVFPPDSLLYQSRHVAKKNIILLRINSSIS